jgi:hypothetical protein
VRRSLALILLVAAAAFAVAGCGGGGDKDKDKGEQAADCGQTPAAMSGAPQLPTAFPTVSGVTYTGQSKEGPTTKVSGFKDGDLDDSFDAYNEALDGKNGWSVTSKEKEEDDAEVNFSGHGTTGQVALKECDEDRTNLTITVRPA